MNIKLEDGRRLGAEALQALRSGAESTVQNMTEAGVFERAAEARRLRACAWANQAPDERIYGEDAFPFAGASDLRVRTAERLVRLRVAEAVSALLRAQVSFGTSQVSPGAARFLAEMWQAVMERDLELEWLEQMSLLSLYLWGGGRGAAGLWIGWDEQVEWAAREMSAQDLSATLAQALGDENTAAITMADPEALAGVLNTFGLVRSLSAAKSAARDFATTGVLRTVQQTLVRSRPSVRALELGVELFVDPRVALGGGDDAEALHLVEWLSPVALRSRALEEDWDEAFTRRVEALCDGGAAASDAIFPEWDYARPEDSAPSRVDLAREQGHVQVVTSYVRAIGPDGVPARYRVVWCPAVTDAAARAAELVQTPWGGWPVMLFSAEVRGPGALDALGVSHRVAGLQTQQKLTADMIADLSMLQLPPVVQKGVANAGAGSGVVIEPLALNQIGVSEDLGFMTPPQLPQTSLAWLKEVRLMIAEAGDLPHEGIAQEVTATLQEQRIGLWLRQCGEAVRRVLALVLSHMEPDALAQQYPELLDGARVGAFPVRLRYNARSWDMEYMERVARIMNNLLVPLDRAGRLNLSEFVATAAMELLPAHSELLKPSDEAAAADERADEERAYLRARAGIRTPVPEGGGADYGARLRFYEELLQSGQALADVAPDKQALVQERIQALRFQLQQQQNAQTGRQGAAATVPAPEAAAAAQEA